MATDSQISICGEPVAIAGRKPAMAKHIIIGPSGIGGALARNLDARGDQPFLVGRNEEKVAALARELGCEFAIADVLDAVVLNEAIGKAGNSIDGLAYCVGSIRLKPLGRLEDSEILSDFELNALGAVHSVKAALPVLKASAQANVSVVLFSTVAVQQGFPSHVSVAMAKGAVEGLTRSLAAELAPKVRVNAIAPSLTKTPLAEFLTKNEQQVQAIAAMHPLQRLGEADDIAALAAFLLGTESGWITGQVIGIDGGRSSLRVRG
jgi:NAD(P)-dependent dehydrogenase (short-subunit alcohol dehydrogenase family)